MGHSIVLLLLQIGAPAANGEQELHWPARDTVGQEIVFEWSYYCRTGVGCGGTGIEGRGLLIDVVLGDSGTPHGVRLDINLGPMNRRTRIDQFEAREGRVEVLADPATLPVYHEVSPFDNHPGFLLDRPFGPLEDVVLQVRESLPILWGEPADPIEVTATQTLSPGSGPESHLHVLTRCYETANNPLGNAPRRPYRHLEEPDRYLEEYAFDPTTGEILRFERRSSSKDGTAWASGMFRLEKKSTRMLEPGELKTLQTLSRAARKARSCSGTNPRRALALLKGLKVADGAWFVALRELRRSAYRKEKWFSQNIAEIGDGRKRRPRSVEPDPAACRHALFHGALNYHAGRHGLTFRTHRRAFEDHAHRRWDASGASFAIELFNTLAAPPQGYESPSDYGFSDVALDPFRKQLEEQTLRLQTNEADFAREFDLPAPASGPLSIGSEALWERAAERIR